MHSMKRMKTPYKITIITPLHDTVPKVFERAHQSMLKQTYGFENIEWIVVLHNCNDATKAYVSELLGTYKNVILEVLDNEIYTPSSPRNYAFPLAHGEFVGYLDADDAYTPACLERALEAIERNDADIVSFRREYETEDPSEQILNEIVLWDQTKKEIVVSPETWDDTKIFCGIWGIVTSKLYRRDFLEEQNLEFDYDIPFAEGFAFNMQAYVRARRICFLPQFIGYTYYIHKGSLVQDTNKDPHELVAYARGFKKMFDAGLADGIYMNDIMTSILYHMSWFISKNKDMTDEILKEIQEILSPYVSLLQPLPVSKLYSSQDSNLRFTFTRATLMNPRDKHAHHPLMLLDSADEKNTRQEQVLERLIRAGQGTDLGKRYKFSHVFSIEEFQDSVPLLDYEFYRPMIDLMTRVGERGIFTHEKPEAYLLSGYPETPEASETQARYLPASESVVTLTRKQLEKIVENHRSAVLFDDRADKVSPHSDEYVDTLFGHAFWSYISRNLNSTKLANTLSTPLSFMFHKQNSNPAYYQLFFALVNDSITQIIAPDAQQLCHYIDLLAQWEFDLAEDIEAGKIRFDDEVSRIINTRLRPNKKRADAIRQARHTDDLVEKVKILWPNLKRIVTEGVGNFKEAQQRLETLFPKVAFENVIFSFPEAQLTKDSFAGKEFALNQEAAFFEFIPLQDEEELNDVRAEEHPLLLYDLIPNTTYQPIVSNDIGLYRYVVPARLHFQKEEDGEYFFTYEGRR